jgi:hypothetical protein
MDTINIEELVKESTEPLYDGCLVNCLQAGNVLMNMANLFGVPYAFLDEYLRFISRDLLPSNCMPRTTYKNTHMMMQMGLKHERIDCYLDGCVLYEEDEYELFIHCLVCLTHYVKGSKSTRGWKIKVLSL